MRETARVKAAQGLKSFCEITRLSVGDNPSAVAVRREIKRLEEAELTSTQLYFVRALVEAVAMRLVDANGMEPACSNWDLARQVCVDMDELWHDRVRGQET